MYYIKKLYASFFSVFFVVMGAILFRWRWIERMLMCNRALCEWAHARARTTRTENSAQLANITEASQS
jgi:hypothetical protein